MDSILVALNKGRPAVTFACLGNRYRVDEPVEPVMFESIGLVEIPTNISFLPFFFSS